VVDAGKSSRRAGFLIACEEQQDSSEMSKLLTGLLGTLWGGGLLYYWAWVKAGFNPVGIFLGAFIFAGGVWYLYLWWRGRPAKSQP
jgi:hypothetical protein